MLVKRCKTVFISFVWMLSGFSYVPGNAAGTDCPLDFTALNFRDLSLNCSIWNLGICCRNLHALVGLALSQHAKKTGEIGVSPYVSQPCQEALASILTVSGFPQNAGSFCGLGTKITLNLQCRGLETVQGRAQNFEFGQLQLKCRTMLSSRDKCQACLNASIIFLRHFLGPANNSDLSICRDAIFVGIAKNDEMDLAIDKARCFFGVSDFQNQPFLLRKPKPFFELPAPSMPPTSDPLYPYANSNIYFIKRPKPYHLTLITGLGTGITGLVFVFFLVMLILIKRKREELDTADPAEPSHPKGDSGSVISPKEQQFQKGEVAMFKYFSYKEVKTATCNFSTFVGNEDFGPVYKAHFEDGLVASVKHIVGSFGLAESDFCKEMEILGRLHHRHLVQLKGICINQSGRFLIYECTENRTLKDYLHGAKKVPLSWVHRLQIASDIAVALEYLHHYCEPPICHGVISSSNILFDNNSVIKLANYGLVHMVSDPADRCVVQGYLDLESISTHQITTKSDIYSFGVLLLELITGRPPVLEDTHLVEWAQRYILEDSQLAQMVDPNLAGTYDFDELKHIIKIIRMCTQREGEARPTIRTTVHALQSQFGMSS